MAFGSFDSQRPSQAVSEINMVPLIDVMLVLLVIFIITAPLLSHSIRINLPQASSQPVEKEPRVVDLAIDEFGTIFWNEESVSMEELAQRFKTESRETDQADVRIRADLDTRYEVLAQVMGSARRQGIKKLGFITRPAAPGATVGADAATGAAAGAPAGPATTAPAAAGQAGTPAATPAVTPPAAASTGAVQPAAQGIQSPDARTAR